MKGAGWRVEAETSGGIRDLKSLFGPSPFRSVDQATRVSEGIKNSSANLVERANEQRGTSWGREATAKGTRYTFLGLAPSFLAESR